MEVQAKKNTKFINSGVYELEVVVTYLIQHTCISFPDQACLWGSLTYHLMRYDLYTNNIHFPWISMDADAYPRISLDIHGYPWISMDIRGYPCRSMDINSLTRFT